MMKMLGIRGAEAAKLCAVGFAVVLLTALPASAAQAFSGAFFPTQSTGNRGSDVKAIQYLLVHRGYAAQPTGFFGSVTDGAVRAFQRNAGLAVTGRVTPSTWAKLVVTLRRGSSGDAVKALQTLLNEKRSAGLSLSGYFGEGTRSAVMTFQRHVGLTVDGVAGTSVWRNLAWHYEYPAFARASLCDYTDPSGNGTAANWGTGAAIGQIQAAAEVAYGRRLGPIAIGDISREHGGEIDGHASHEDGLDVDIRPVRYDRAQCRYGTFYYRSSYDRAATRELVRAIRATASGHVRLIYFNDPVLVREGLTIAYPNHDGHLHIRYCEAYHPDSRYDC